MKGIGIVFSGGGGKGAYEIGVWKYLHEIGLDQYIRVVSGTSVGALNAALLVGSCYSIAEDLWLHINPEKILTPKKVLPKEIIEWLTWNGVIMNSPVLKKIEEACSMVFSETLFGMEKLAQLMISKYYTDSFFSRDGLESMILDGINFTQLKNSSIPCYVTCLRCPGFRIERFKINDYDDQDIIKLLLASSAIPLIFPNERFKGNCYCDGGIIGGDNIPVKPVYDTGVENIIVVHLSQDSIINKSEYSKARIIEIVPSEDLGNVVTGTLDFSEIGSAKRLQLGYLDAKKIMEPMIELLLMNAENQRVLKMAQQHNIEYEKKKKILREELSIIQAMGNDGFSNVLIELTEET